MKILAGIFCLTLLKHATATTSPSTTMASNMTTTMRPIGNLYMHQAHGLFMLTAWMPIISLALLLSRYYRPAWPNNKLFGKAVWFQLHTFLNVVGLLLIGISIVVIFSAVRGISGFKSFRPLFTKMHPYLGMVVTGMVFLNALMSMCRGAPKDTQRKVFNWVHWALGIIAYISGIVMIFSGLNMSSFCPTWTLWVMLGWCIFHICICVILELQKCCSKEIVEKRFPQVYSAIPEGLGGNDEKKGDGTPTEKDSLLHQVTKPVPQGNGLRYMLLVLWIVVTLVFFGVLFWGTLTGSWTGI